MRSRIRFAWRRRPRNFDLAKSISGMSRSEACEGSWGLRLFAIDSPFFPRRATGADDPKRTIGLPLDVDDGEQAGERMANDQGPVRMRPIGIHICQGIGEHLRRLFERDAVLPSVRDGLRVVPFEFADAHEHANRTLPRESSELFRPDCSAASLQIRF